MNSIIDDEIKKNGNTNFISDSGFESNQQIFSIGDSHSIFFYNSMKIKEHWFFGCNLPLTMYSLSQKGLDIYNVGTAIGNGHELYNIKANDFVLMSFGYNDMQRNIFLHAADRYEEEIFILLDSYIKTIIQLKNNYSIIPIVSFIYPLSTPNACGLNTLGSDEERKMYIKYGNELLKKFCLSNNLLFFDIYDLVSDGNGYMKAEYTHDGIHLDYNNSFLREHIDNIIVEMCKPYCLSTDK